MPETIWNGMPIGAYQPGFMYPFGHPYHHDNFLFNGASIGVYQRMSLSSRMCSEYLLSKIVAGFAYPVGHPYYGFGGIMY
jgi:hypothetical protein